MRLVSLLSLYLVACTQAYSVEPVDATNRECIFEFINSPQCSYKTRYYSITVEIETNPVADDERELVRASVIVNENKQTVTISDDTTMLEGNKGVVLFDDINFDGVPDLAISTSFGIANQYLDYWIYDQKNQSYVLVGNLPRLMPDAATKTLSSQVKMNAANYELTKYKWDKLKLEKVP